MCLLLLALDVVPGRPWLLLANRDEFRARASAVAGFWSDHPQICGGRDLVAGGTWLALNRNGRFAAVTNVRTAALAQAPRSRGELVTRFLTGADSVVGYLDDVCSQRDQYGPFNLVVGDTDQAGFVSSLDGKPRLLEHGVHAFSNGSRDDEWPKMRRLRGAFTALVRDPSLDDAALLDLLVDTQQPDDAELPDTGVGLPLERVLAPIFIRGDERYGTRASTLVYAGADGALTMIERQFGPGGVRVGEVHLDAPP